MTDTEWPVLDRTDPDVQRLEPKMRRGDMDEMSFAFRVIKQSWDYAPDFDDDPYSLRIIEEVSLHKGDVSVVNYGANDTTSADLRGPHPKPLTLTEADTVAAGGRLSLADAQRIAEQGAW